MGELHIMARHDAVFGDRGRRSRQAPDAIFESDHEYFRRRGEEERRRACGIDDPLARSLHLDLANRYATLSAAIREAADRTG